MALECDDLYILDKIKSLVDEGFFNFKINLNKFKISLN